jgi:hypothetical protein
VSVDVCTVSASVTANVDGTASGPNKLHSKSDNERNQRRASYRLHKGSASIFAFEQNHRNEYCVKDWEIIADNLSKSGWRCGCISSTDREGRQFWVVAAERSDAGRFIVHADEKLTAFVELESAIRTGIAPRHS